MPKLRDLDATFLVYKGDPPDSSYWRRDINVAEADGVLFMCPGCQNHYVRVWFANRPRVPTEATPKPRWNATGAGLDDLSLAPSISLDVPEARAAGTCLWHGWVTGGNAA